MIDQELHVVIASDGNYAQYVAVVLVSLFENTIDFKKVNIHLLSTDLDEATLLKINQHIPAERGALFVYDADSVVNKVNIKVQEGFSISAYSRLFLTTILPNSIDKVLYLDCDVLIRGQLTNLWKENLDTFYIAAVADSTLDKLSRIRIGLSNNYYYINSGVLLINLKEWRLNNLEERFIETIKEYNGNVYHKDQGVLNKVCKDHLKILHPKYNVQTNFFSHPYCLMTESKLPFYSEKEYLDARNLPLIVHFTLGFYNRPWCEKADHPMADKWRSYRDKTAWADIPLLPDRRLFQIKFLGWLLNETPLFIFKVINKLVYFIYSLRH